jgi:hypothetical protein
MGMRARMPAARMWKTCGWIVDLLWTRGARVTIFSGPPRNFARSHRPGAAFASRFACARPARD